MRIACFLDEMEFLGKRSEGLMDHNSFVPVGELKQGWKVPFFPHASWSGRLKHFKVSSCKQRRQVFLEEVAGGLPHLD